MALYLLYQVCPDALSVLPNSKFLNGTMLNLSAPFRISLNLFTGGQSYLGKRIDKIEHEGMGNCVRIEISQDTDDADQKVKWFLKVHKKYKVLWEAYFSHLFPKFLFRFVFYKFFDFHPLKM